ncbi:MAG TPA: M13 family metallopeptidase N-terminal domain-containing protein, partial [Rhodanobacter sp.]
MNCRILALVCLGALLAGTAQAGEAANGKPQYGAWGFDAAGAQMSIKPGDNFFRYANGTWLDRTPIPADKPAVSLRLAMTDRTEQRLHAMMEAAAARTTDHPATLQDKVGAFYHSFMDAARIEALGARPIAPQLDAVRHANTRDALAALMGRTNLDFDGTLFNLGIDVDLKDPKRYAVYVGQGGLG